MRQGGAASKEEVAASYDVWWNTVTGSDKTKALRAAKFPVGIKGYVSGLGNITDASLNMEPFIDQATKRKLSAMGAPVGWDRSLVLKFENPDEASAAREQYLKSKISSLEESEMGDLTGLSPELQQALEGQPEGDGEQIKQLQQNLLNEYLKRSEGNKVFIPLNEENKEVLQMIHQKAFEMHKRPFQLNENPIGMPTRPSPGTAPKDKYSLDQFDSEY
jgi:hypothetical protein